MLQSSFSAAASDDSPGAEAPRHQPLSVVRRASLAVLLPVWVVVGFLLSLILIDTARVVLIAIGVPLGAINPAILNTILAALSYLMTAVIVIGLPGLVKKSRTTAGELGLKRLPEWQDILLAAAGFAIYMVLAGILITLVSNSIPGFNAEQSQEVGFENLSRGYEYLLAFLTLVVIAPVAEEVLMRGYLYGKLRKIVPIAIAMLVTALLFAVLHLQWNVAVDVFALSIVLTSLREVTGSIWASILVHMMKNGLAFYLLFIDTSFLHTIGR